MRVYIAIWKDHDSYCKETKKQKQYITDSERGIILNIRTDGM